MGYSITKQSNTEQYDLLELVCDTKADISTLPNLNSACAGSFCFCIEDSSVWMLGSDDIWHEI